MKTKDRQRERERERERERIGVESAILITHNLGIIFIVYYFHQFHPPRDTAVLLKIIPELAKIMITAFFEAKASIDFGWPKSRAPTGEWT